MMRQIYIFGAHSRARTLAEYIRTLFPDSNVKGFLVDNDEDNPISVDGIEVVYVNSENKHLFDTSCPVYLAIRSVHHKKVINALREVGFSDIIPVTPKLDIELRNKYMSLELPKLGLKFNKLKNTSVRKNIETDRLPSASIYVVHSEFDGALIRDCVLNSYERYIQAGTAVSHKRLPECTLFDDVGDNISLKNKQFCELTALYWIWKNADTDIVGLEHYRRRFLLPKDWLQRFIDNDIDLILPTPLYVAPNLKENYIYRHSDVPWKVMMDALGAESKSAEEFFSNNGIYSPCNMFLTKKDVCNELCEWLFPILFNVNERVGNIKDNYQNRYPGFLSERLINFFFFKNRNKYKVIYEDKSFYASL